MKTTILIVALGLMAGCSSPTDESVAPAPATADAQESMTSPETATPQAVSPSEDMPSANASTADTASATGVVEAVDPIARTLTIAHGPVAALEWPAMTMTFQAPDVDLGSIEQGDQVSFEFTSTGMDGTITSMTRQ